METYHSWIPHEVHIWLSYHVGAFKVVIGVALRISNSGRVEGYAIEGAMAMETVVNIGLRDLRIRVAYMYRCSVKVEHKNQAWRLCCSTSIKTPDPYCSFYRFRDLV
jgi:hypothetical protein